MKKVTEMMGLAPDQAEYEGRGYLHSDDVINAGFIQGDTSHVMVQVVYDELAVLDDYEGVDISPLTRELTPENPYALNLMRITVDGEPIDDPERSSADVQRCTDVALEDNRHTVRFRQPHFEPEVERGGQHRVGTVAQHQPGRCGVGARPIPDVFQLRAFHRQSGGTGI